MGPMQAARQGVDLLRSALAAAAPDQVTGSGAAAMAEVFAEAERVAAAAKVLYARRAAEVGAHEAGGHRDTAGWLATVWGDPVGKARRTLEVAETVAKSPTVQEAFAKGELSLPQAEVIGAAAALNPAAAGDLLAAAKKGSYRELKGLADRAQRLARSEEDEVAREHRVHARRHCRISEPEAGGLRIDA